MTKTISSWFHFHFLHWSLDITEYYIFKTLSQIGKSLTNLFIPIYLLSELHYSLWQVTLYFVILQIFFPPTIAFAGEIIQKIGLKKSMALSLPCFALYFWGINFLKGDFFADLVLIIVLLMVRGVSGGISNLANDIFMAKHVLKKIPGKMIAWLKIAMTVATLIAPFVGGLVTYFFGFDMLFYVAIGLMLLSGVPLFLTPDIHFRIQYRPSSLITFLLKKARPNYLWAEFGNVFTDTMMWILWPIFLFFALDNTAEMGSLVTISAIFSIIVSFFVGRKITEIDPQKMIRRGVVGASFLFFCRPLFLHPVAIGVIDALYKIIDPIFRIPYDRAAYRLVMEHENIIKRANIKQFVAEIYYTLGTLILFLLTLFFDKSSKPFFITLFLFAALTMLLMMRMAYVKFKSMDQKIIATEQKEGVVEKDLEILERGEF